MVVLLLVPDAVSDGEARVEALEAVELSAESDTAEVTVILITSILTVMPINGQQMY